VNDAATGSYKRTLDGREKCMVAFRPHRFVNYRSGRKLHLIAKPQRYAERASMLREYANSDSLIPR
jgi:hypothetical protein